MQKTKLNGLISRTNDLLPRLVDGLLWTSETDSAISVLSEEELQAFLTFAPQNLTCLQVSENYRTINPNARIYDVKQTNELLENQWLASFQSDDVITRKWARLMAIFEMDCSNYGCIMVPAGPMPYVVWDVYVFGSIQRFRFFTIKTQLVET